MHFYDLKCISQCHKKQTASGWGFTPDSTGEAYDASQDPLVGWGGASVFI